MVTPCLLTFVRRYADNGGCHRCEFFENRTRSYEMGSSHCWQRHGRIIIWKKRGRREFVTHVAVTELAR